MPKKIFTEELEGTRRRGRPRKGWREEVERDLQVLGVRRWRELVIDREKWRGIVRQAKVHSGPTEEEEEVSSEHRNHYNTLSICANLGFFSVCVCVCVCVCARVCARACVCVCVCLEKVFHTFT